ncbi:MAG: glycosyltransferase [Verrucomicrobiota bacterium]|nr:glycosyltransferase [Verrucomicrobiota bacterium]
MHPEELFVKTLAARERYRDEYWKRRDPILNDRMLWRAQTFRHVVHLLPQQTILEIGCGEGIFTRRLAEIARGECPITAVTFRPDAVRPERLPEPVNFLRLSSLPGELGESRFQFIIAHDMLDQRNSAWLMQRLYEVLLPGGEVLFYESNPWNIVLRLRRFLAGLFGEDDPRLLLSRAQMYELLSEVGFTRLFAVFNDFVYAPLTRHLAWTLRNLSIVLENAPGLRTLAGSILVHAQKPPRPAQSPKVSLYAHPELRRAVSIVVPCHNEEMNVGPLVARLRNLFDEYIHEIILVDDNSRDGTREALRRLAEEDPRIRPIYRSPPNGVGLALAQGLRETSGQYVLCMDCDFQHLLPEIRDLFDTVLQGYDVAVGSRFSRHSVVLNYPFQKIVANRLFHALAQLVLWGRFRDLTNNLKLMRREVVNRLELLEPGFAVNAEIGLQPLMMGYRVKEVPISWIGRGIDMGASSFKVWRVGGGYWRVLRRIWRFRFFRAGPYSALATTAQRSAGMAQAGKERSPRIATDRMPLSLKTPTEL